MNPSGKAHRTLVLLAACAALASRPAFAHGDPAGLVAVFPDGVSRKAGAFELKLQLKERLSGKTFSKKDLEWVHERKIHAFIFDPR